MNVSSQSNIVPIWTGGIPFAIWITQLDIIEKTISKQKLTPLAQEHYHTFDFGQQTPIIGRQFARGTQKEKIRIDEIIPIFPGGLNCPHLHYKGDIYLLNDQQWKTFSNNIIEGFKDKLSRIGTVSFDQLVKASEVFDSLV